MNILVTTHYWDPHLGGIERVARCQAAELAARGHSVRVLTSDLGGSVEGRVSAPMPGIDFSRIWAWNGLERLGVPWPAFAFRISRVAKELVGWCDVALCHGQLFHPTLVTLLHAQDAGKRTVLVQHNPHVTYGRQLLDLAERTAAASLGRWALNRADAILVPSEATRTYVRQLTRRPVTVLPWGIDLQALRPHPSEQCRDEERRSLGIGTRTVLIVAAGRLTAKNRFELLIEAANRAGREIPRLRCVIVGRGCLHDHLRRVAARSDSRVTIDFPGYLTDAQLRALLRSADLAVATAGTNEGFGLLVAEALASGTPVVVGREGGHVDLVQGGVNGWFFDGSAANLAETIGVAYRQIQAEGRAGWAARARRSVDSLTWSEHCQTLERALAVNQVVSV